MPKAEGGSLLSAIAKNLDQHPTQHEPKDS